MFVLKTAAIMILGSTMIAFGVHQFILPIHIFEGGLIGLAIILNYMFGTSIGLIMIVLGIPIYIWSYFYKKPLFFNSSIGLILSAILIDRFKYLPQYIDLTPLASAITGGIMLGVGIGIMLKQDITTDGMDLLAQMLADMTRLNVGIYIFIFDLLILSIGTSVVNKDQFILSLIAITCVASVTSIITFGHYKTKPDPPATVG